MRDNELIRHLREVGAKNVNSFELKLQQNAEAPTVERDLRSEALAALMFASSGFSVEMGDSPDLLLSRDGCTLGAEVKRFRLKKQDEMDDARLRAADGILVEYGDTLPSEGTTAWDQVVAVADAKAHQYREDMPNILVIQSSSVHCVDDLVVLTAANILNERAGHNMAQPLVGLNGLMLMSLEYNVSVRRGVYFFELLHVRRVLPPGVREALACIRTWHV